MNREEPSRAIPGRRIRHLLAALVVVGVALSLAACSSHMPAEPESHESVSALSPDQSGREVARMVITDSDGISSRGPTFWESVLVVAEDAPADVYDAVQRVVVFEKEAEKAGNTDDLAKRLDANLKRMEAEDELVELFRDYGWINAKGRLT